MALLCQAPGTFPPPLPATYQCSNGTSEAYSRTYMSRNPDTKELEHYLSSFARGLGGGVPLLPSRQQLLLLSLHSFQEGLLQHVLLCRHPPQPLRLFCCCCFCCLLCSPAVEPQASLLVGCMQLGSASACPAVPLLAAVAETPQLLLFQLPAALPCTQNSKATRRHV